MLYNGQISRIIKISGTPEDEKMCLNWYVLCAVNGQVRIVTAFRKIQKI